MKSSTILIIPKHSEGLHELLPQFLQDVIEHRECPMFFETPLGRLIVGKLVG